MLGKSMISSTNIIMPLLSLWHQEVYHLSLLFRSRIQTSLIRYILDWEEEIPL